MICWFTIGWSGTLDTPTISRDYLGLPSTFGIIVCLFLLISGLRGTVLQTIENSNKARNDQIAFFRINDQLNDMDRSGQIAPDSLIFMVGGNYYLDKMPPLILYYPEPKLIMFGWLTSSPLLDATISSYGISIPGRSLFEKDNVYVMGYAGLIPIIKEFILEHYGVEVSVTNPVNLCSQEETESANCDRVLFQFSVK
jgi:hypothetical protein